jgi:hypothetical protein
MTTHQDRDRSQDDQEPQAEEGQVSETSRPEPAVGGADATDKSTGTAPGQADQPDA